MKLWRNAWPPACVQLLSEFLEQFEAIVARQPDAVVCEVTQSRTRMTYGELRDAARGLAERLRSEYRVVPGELLALACEPGLDLIVAMLGVWFADAAYLPLDLTHPPARREQILAAAGPAVIITGDRIVRSKTRGEHHSAAPDDQVGLRASDALAYVIFTSGSTGAPRGVAVSHAGITNFLNAQIKAFRLGPGRRLLKTLSPAFDASLSEIGATLLSGATLVFAPDPLRHGPEYFARALAEENITHVCLPPAVLAHWPARSMPDHLRTVIIGGEVAPVDGVRDWARRLRVINVYGRTEATVCTSLWQCDEYYSRPYLGAPVPGMTWRVVDANGVTISRAGDAGELWLAGPGLALGYWRDAQRTAERFVYADGRRWYRTGDQVRVHEDGQLEFLGRIDRQVQVHGNRVELFEVESCLLEHPEVRAAAVVQTEDGELCAWVVPRDMTANSNATKIDAAKNFAERLRVLLRERLPEYFVPARIVVRGQLLPVNANGKIDHAALASEARIARIWEKILGVPVLTDDASFFELGGSSFAVFRMLAATVGSAVAVPVAEFYRDPTIAGVVGRAREAADLTRDTTAPANSTRSLREDVRFGLEFRRSVRARKSGTRADSPRRIFLTGATGLFGGRILKDLLMRTSAEVICLVRNPAAARTEQLQALGATNQVEFQKRVRIVAGDLALPGLGLTATDWRFVAGECDTILHCGARVNLLDPYERLRAENVDACRDILRLALHGPAKNLHYVSTLSVNVASDDPPGVFYEPDRLSATVGVFGGYARSKWTAEYFFHHARAAGYYDLSMYRPGWILNDCISRGSENTFMHDCDRAIPPRPFDLLVRFVQAIALLGIAPEPETIRAFRMDCTPLEYAAGVIVRLLQKSAQSPGDSKNLRTYHVTGDAPLYLNELLRKIAERTGRACDRLPVQQFETELARLMRAGSTREAEAAAVLQAALGWRLGLTGANNATGHTARSQPNAALRAFDLFAATDREFDTTHIRRDLDWPDRPTTADAIDRFLQALL